MRTLTYALCLALIAPTLASAGPLANDAYNLSLELQREEPYLNRGQSAQIQQRLDAIRRILRGEGINPQPPVRPRPARDYICVSRDNDGMNPYMIGYKDFTTVVRIPGTVLGSKAECEDTLAKARHQGDNAMLCLSRDNDGMNPRVVAALDRQGRVTKLEKATASNKQGCERIMNDMRYTREGVLYCGSRDNDGMSPYVAVGYRYNGSVSVGNESFSSYEACVNSL